MRVAVVDDEPLARDVLVEILSAASGIDVAACYKNG